MKWVLSIAVVLIAGVVLTVVTTDRSERSQEPAHNSIFNNREAMADITLTSSVFANGDVVSSRYTCDGDNVNPPLEWSAVPDNAQSLVLIMDDPDAIKPAGKVWDHWVVFNIPLTINNVREGEEPEGIRGINSGGGLGYQGPCPPDGEHRYVFKLYALDTVLTLDEGATKREVEEAMDGHILADGELMGRYTRQ